MQVGRERGILQGVLQIGRLIKRLHCIGLDLPGVNRRECFESHWRQKEERQAWMDSAEA